MQSHISRLNTRYHCYSDHSTASQLQRRLDALLQELLPAAWAAALDQAFAADETVYVLRRVDARLPLVVRPGTSDSELARRWSRHLCGATLHTMATGDDANLVRFANQVAYTASFLVDLLRGLAWQRWFYGPFRHLQEQNPAAAAVTVLTADPTRLPALLAELQQRGALTDLLALLAPEQQHVVWKTAGPAAARAEPAAFRPFVTAICSVLDHLQLWGRGRPDPAVVLNGFVATRPASPDWRDQRGLAATCVAILHWLADNGYLRAGAGADPTVRSAVEAAPLADLDWLDRATIRSALLTLLAPANPAPPATASLPQRPATGEPTPRQRALYADLLAVFTAGLQLDQRHPAAPANCLRWYAALVARTPDWAGDRLATATIQELLAAADPAAALAALTRRGATVRHRRDRQLQPTGERQPAAPAASPRVFATNCAGVFLLARAVLDCRLPALARRSGRTPGDTITTFQALLAALGLHWAGAAGLAGTQLDAGLALLAGLETAPDRATLRAALAPDQAIDYDLLQAELLQLLVGQRLLRGAELHIYRTRLPGGVPALVAGGEAADLWLPGRVLTAPHETGQTIAGWRGLWQETTGRPPLIVAEAALAPELLAALPAAELLVVADDTTGDAPGDERIALQRAGSAALAPMLQALATPWPGLPAADLSLTLVANALLRVWARWLQRGFARSSAPYLLDNFIRRAGRVVVDAHSITVEMESRPFDLLITMAGYTADLEQVSWLGQRRLRLHLGAAVTG